MATATYVPIATTTLTASGSTYTFTGIPQTYTDLILVANWTATTDGAGGIIRVGNGSIDTGNNYASVYAVGRNNSTFVQASEPAPTTSGIYIGEFVGAGATNGNTAYCRIVNYTSTSYRKVFYLRYNFSYSSGTSWENAESIGLWRSTSAIDQIRFSTTSLTWASGTITLYGIKAA